MLSPGRKARKATQENIFLFPFVPLCRLYANRLIDALAKAQSSQRIADERLFEVPLRLCGFARDFCFL
jgi:hypothetical protein